MAKELPFLKFFPGEFLSGDITLCSDSAIGVFTKLICYYWKKDCNFTQGMLEARFKNNQTELDELKDMEIIKAQGDRIVIEFLDEQFDDLKGAKVKQIEGGRKGGLRSAQGRLKHLDQDKEKDQDIDKRKENFHRSLKEFFTQENKSMIKAFYDYWSEESQNGNLMRYELEKTWNTKSRLNNWIKREFNNKKK